MLDRLLPRDPRARTATIAVAAVVLLLVFTQLVLPGTGGGGRGTPMAVLFKGVVQGTVTALTAAGIIVLFRTLRIVNFAQSALGVAGATLVFSFVQFTSVPFPIAFLLGVALAAIIGFLTGLFTLRFARSPRLVLSVFTILLAGVLASFSGQVRSLPFFPDADELTIGEQLGNENIRPMLPFPGFSFEIGDMPFTFGFPEVFAIEVAILALLALAAFFRFTKAGVAVRALAENSERASLLGIGVGTLSCIVWAIAGALAGTSVTLTGILIQPGVATGFAPGVLLPALAAAVIAKLQSLPVAVAAAVGISVATAAAEWSLVGDQLGLIQVGLFLAVAFGLVLQRGSMGRSEDASGASSWQATDEQRPIPKELLGVPGLRIARYGIIGVVLLAVLVYPFVVSVGATNIGGVIATNAIVVLSLVVLTGWAGQVSLGQYAFVALGTVIGGALTASVGIPFWFAVPITAAIVGGLAMLVGIPALRVKGLLLLVTTFAFAIAVRAVLFEERFFGWLLPDAVERPSLFLLDFDDERSMYYLCVGALALSIAVVLNLRKSRFGRILIAVRENEANVQAFGVDATRTKLYAFALSGGLAGFAGAIFVHHQRGVSAGSFGAQASIDVFITAIFGGVSSVPGALIGAAYFAYVNYFFSSQLFQDVLVSIIPFYLLYTSPGGVASILSSVRDAGLRVIAQRRQIVVPSLFADFDAEALERRLIPLDEPVAGAGLEALGGRRFHLPTELYARGGKRLLQTFTPTRSREADALGVAARMDDAPATAIPAEVPA